MDRTGLPEGMPAGSVPVDPNLLSALLNRVGQMEKEEEISLYEYWLVVKRRWKILALIFIGVVLLSAIISFRMTPIFRATTTLIPVESPQSLSAALGQISGLPFVSGMMKNLPTSTADKLKNILESRTVAEGVIRKCHLIKEFFPEEEGGWLEGLKNSLVDSLQGLLGGKDLARREGQEGSAMEKALKKLKDIVDISKSRDGLITVSVEYKDPKIAADIGNQFTEELNQFLLANSLTFSKKNRIFVENQLKSAKEELSRSEEQLKNYQEKTKILSINTQAEAALKALAEIKAQIILKEMQLGVLREFSTEQNMDVIRTKDEINELKKQYDKLESEKASSRPSSIPSLEEAPGVGLEYIRLKRKALIDEKLFELLKQQYELAKIEEAKEDISFQIIDRAKPPEEKVKPKRMLIVVISGLTALFIGIFFVFLLEYLEKVKQPIGVSQSRS